jgi:SAM-dependent methyltransferase
VTTEREPLVDYESSAARYRRGRELTPAQAERWRAAVSARLPAGPWATVIDAGAGTGVFLPLLASLGAHRIVAVEPSSAMRGFATARRVAGAEVVAGTLASLPLADDTADVVWISAVLHHVADPVTAFAEVARVLRPGGRLLVRGLVPGRSRVPWLDHVPGADRALARFPDLGTLTRLATDAGLRLAATDTVVDGEPRAPADLAAWIIGMRSADSLLTALTDDEIATGLAALRRLDGPLDPVTLSLVTFEAP